MNKAASSNWMERISVLLPPTLSVSVNERIILSRYASKAIKPMTTETIAMNTYFIFICLKLKKDINTTASPAIVLRVPVRNTAIIIKPIAIESFFFPNFFTYSVQFKRTQSKSPAIIVEKPPNVVCMPKIACARFMPKRISSTMMS